MAGRTATRSAHALPAAQDAAAPAVRDAVARDRARAHRVPAGAVQALAVPGEEQRRALQDQPPDRPRALEGEARLPGRVVAGVRGRQRLRRRARARQGDQGRPRDRPRRQERPRALVAQAALARRVLAAGGQRARVLRHRGRHRLRAARQRRRACAGATRPAAPSRAASRSTRGACSSATTAARSTPSASATARRSGQTSSAGTAFGLKAGSFYSTPAAAYGRVYIGSLDGFVYSFAASNGKLAWRHKTGSYVYSSPAVASVPGAGPTVYIGSYDGRLYAFDARSGRVRWTHDAGGKISGAPGRRRRPRLLLEPRAALVGGRRRRRPASSCGRPAAAPSTRSSPTAGGCTSWATRASSCSPRRAQARQRRARPRRPRPRRPAPAPRGPSASPPAASAQLQRIHKRQVARRVAARRAAVRRNRRLRRQHRAICFKSHGRTVCRVPRPLVCVAHHNGPTVCRPRKRLGRRRRGWVVAGGAASAPAAGSVPPGAASSTAPASASARARSSSAPVRRAPSSWCPAGSSCPAAACRCSWSGPWSSSSSRRSSSSCVEDERRATAAEDRRVMRAADHRAPGDELGQRHGRDGDDAGEQAGGDGELPVPAGGALAPVDAHLAQPRIGAHDRRRRRVGLGRRLGHGPRGARQRRSGGAGGDRADPLRGALHRLLDQRDDHGRHRRGPYGAGLPQPRDHRGGDDGGDCGSDQRGHVETAARRRLDGLGSGAPAWRGGRPTRVGL